METLSLNLQMVVMLALLAATVYLFVFSSLRVDVAALCIMVAMGLINYVPGMGGLIAPEVLFSGFASNAVVSIIAVMIIGGGLDRTGIMNVVASMILKRGGKSVGGITPLLAGSAAFVSAFMQNIGVAALFLPVASRLSARTGIPMSQLLMPMGFCVILGGTATMIGASPQILLNDLIASANRTLPPAQQIQEFGLFALLPVGITLSIAGLLYFVLAGRFILPQRKGDAAGTTARAADYFQKVYGVSGELFEARVTIDSPIVGQTIHTVEETIPNTPFVLALYNGDVVKLPPDREETLWVNSRIGLLGDRQQIEAFCRDNAIELLGQPDRFADVLNAQHSGIAEVVIPPRSSLVGRTIGEIKPRRSFGTNILRIQRTESVIGRGYRDTALHAGDTLLVHASWRDLYKLSQNRDVVVVADIKYEELRPQKIRTALLWFVLSIAMFLYSNSLSLSLITAAMGMVVTGVLSIDEAYRSISWQTVFLLASLIPLGMAVDHTGTATWIAQQMLLLIGDVPIWVMQTVLAGMAMFFSLVMSNVGATTLLVPLAINIAQTMGADPGLFALTVAVSTSNAFLIPTNQVNALIMGPGNYTVADFMRAGGGMTLIFLVVSLLSLNFLIF